jgi:tetratricopeptide (TPR) repeat protein
MRIEGARVNEALNRQPPDGRPVPVKANAYAQLSPEVRQTRAAEALLEAGRLFRARNYGRALVNFEEAIAANPSADSYYFAALCHQEMQEEAKAIERLQDGVSAFPSDPTLQRALGMLHYQRGEEALARVRLSETLRLAPGDRQAAFVLERMGGLKQPAMAQGMRP